MSRYLPTPTRPCLLCGARATAEVCNLCADIPATALLAGARSRAGAALWLSVRPGVAYVLLESLLADLAGETDVRAFTDTGMTEVQPTPFAWLDVDALRAVVHDAVRDWSAGRREANRLMEEAVRQDPFRAWTTETVR